MVVWLGGFIKVFDDEFECVFNVEICKGRERKIGYLIKFLILKIEVNLR